MPMSADAAKLSEADKVALKQATVACKAEMKEKKIRWPKSRTYINECLKEASQRSSQYKDSSNRPAFRSARLIQLLCDDRLGIRAGREHRLVLKDPRAAMSAFAVAIGGKADIPVCTAYVG